MKKEGKLILNKTSHLWSKVGFFLLTLTISSLFLPKSVYAVCPVCTVAVGAGLGISRWLGIDDSIVGVWIGGLVVSSSVWFASDVIPRLKFKVPFAQILSLLLIGGTIYAILYLSEFVGLPYNTILGIDKIIFGAVLGMVVFTVSSKVDDLLRKSNEGKVYIYYQKVLLPMVFLTLVSYIMYLVTI